MSRMAKAVLALSVVAGIGASVLPMSSYAAVGETKTQNVVITTSVENAISMEFYDYETNIPIANTIDTNNDGINDAKLVDLGTPTVGEVTSKIVKVSVATSNTYGYNLSIRSINTQDDTDTNSTKMRLWDDSTKQYITDSWPTGGEAPYKTTIEAGDPESNNTESKWGYKVGSIPATEGDPIAYDTTAYNAVTRDDVSIRTTNQNSADDVLIDFGVKVTPGQREGTYRSEVVITATARDENGVPPNTPPSP